MIGSDTENWYEYRLNDNFTPQDKENIMHSMKDDWAEMGPGNCPCDSINLQLVDHVKLFNKKLEDLVLEAFRVRGFPKDWVQRNAKRISCRWIYYTADCEEMVYTVDKCDLFKVKIIKKYDDDRFTIDYHVTVESYKSKTPT